MQNAVGDSYTAPREPTFLDPCSVFSGGFSFNPLKVKRFLCFLDPFSIFSGIFVPLTQQQSNGSLAF